MLAHLRTESYSFNRETFYPPATLKDQESVTVTQLEQQIDSAKRRVGYLGIDERASSPDIQMLLDMPKRDFGER